MTKEEMAALSGEDNFKSVQLPTYDELGLNGNEGVFYAKLKTKPKVKQLDEFQKEYEAYEKVALGKVVELVWLKLRRKLVEKTQDGVVRQTSEHNTKTDVVSIYHYNGQATQHGIVASSINGDTGLYPKMKVNQLVYALDLVSGNIIKVILKGGSLSMQEKLEGATLFYDYIGSMDKTKDEHFYTMTNVMTGTPYKTKLGVKYFANFTKGRALTPEEMEKVGNALAKVSAELTAYDLAKATAKVDPIKPQADADKPAVDLDDMPTIDYGDTNVNVDDIPF